MHIGAKGVDEIMNRKTEYDLAYAKQNIRRVTIGFNRNTDSDLIDYVESIENMQKYLKDLIRQDMEKRK